MYSKHEIIKYRSNDTNKAYRQLMSAKRNSEPAPSLLFMLYGTEAPSSLQQSEHVLARALCGDLYQLDALLHTCEKKDLLSSFVSGKALWEKHLGEIDENLKKSLNELFKECNLESLDNFVQASYDKIKPTKEDSEAPALTKTDLFTMAILGRIAFELRSQKMAEGGVVYGYWLTTLPYHASNELDVTLEPRHSRQNFDKVFGKSSTPAFLFHSFYNSGSANNTFSILERIHRRSGFYWMRLSKMLGLSPYETLENLDRSLGLAKNGEALIPLEYYHRHFLDKDNSSGKHIGKLFPGRDYFWDYFNYMVSMELPAEFPNSLKSYQLSVYFKLLMSDPHLSPKMRKECLERIQPFTESRFEWVKSSSLLPLRRWTSEISAHHNKPFALELQQMFRPVLNQSNKGVFKDLEKSIRRYLSTAKIGNIKINREESAAYVASLMLRNLELLALKASSEEMDRIKVLLEPLSRRVDALMNAEEHYQINSNQNFEETFGAYIEAFVTTGVMSITTKLHLREGLRKFGQPIELVGTKKKSFSNIIYSLAFDSCVLELTSYFLPVLGPGIVGIKTMSKAISDGSVEDILKQVLEIISIDENDEKIILESAKSIDESVKWFEKNKKWMEYFPYTSDLLKFCKRCISWDNDNHYKLATHIQGIAHLHSMLNSALPGRSMEVRGGIIQAFHNHYFDAISNLSYKSQQLFAEAIAHAMLGGLIVRHTNQISSHIGKGSDKVYDILQECIQIHGAHILALAPPLLRKDGRTITAKEIVQSSSKTLEQKPIYPVSYSNSSSINGFFKQQPGVQQVANQSLATNSA